MPKRVNPNGYGSVVKLSGNRVKAYEVRVNTRIDDRGFPVYDVLNRYEDKRRARIDLALYNDNKQQFIDEHPDCLLAKKLLKKEAKAPSHGILLRAPEKIEEFTFADIYNKFYNKKFVDTLKVYSASTVNCTKAAYNHCASLHHRIYKDLRPDDFRLVLNQVKNGKNLTHAMQEHIKNLFNQMDRYALENDYIIKSYFAFARIEIPDDDKPGVPFTRAELRLLWANKDKPYVNLVNMTMIGGIKTAAGKDRIVPIHPAIFDMLKTYIDQAHSYIIPYKSNKMGKAV